MFFGVIKCVIVYFRLISIWFFAPQRFDARSEHSGGLYPTICREGPGAKDSDDEQGSGEYFSGEEFHEDNIMFTKDR